MEPARTPWLLGGRGIDASNVTFDTSSMSSGQRVLMACFLGAAFWNSICMVPLVFLTFRRYWTLYFWTVLLSDLGVLVCATEQIMSVSVPGANQLLVVALSSVGWPLMVTGQSLVLYSRLHMLDIARRTLRLVLAMVVVNGLAIHATGIALSVGIQFHRARLVVPYSIFERINIAGFFVQETILSGIYLWKSRALLGQYKRGGSTGTNVSRESGSLPIVRSILCQLIIVNLVVLSLDVTIIVLEYAGLYQLQLGYKVFAYSAKLQCEIAILNRLLEFASRTKRLNARNWDVELSSVLQREWDSTLQRAFGASAQQEDGGSPPGSHAGSSKRRPGPPSREMTQVP